MHGDESQQWVRTYVGTFLTAERFRWLRIHAAEVCLHYTRSNRINVADTNMMMIGAADVFLDDVCFRVRVCV